MRKVEPLPTRDCEAGYGPAFAYVILLLNIKYLSVSVIFVVEMWCVYDVIIPKRCIWSFSSAQIFCLFLFYSNFAHYYLHILLADKCILFMWPYTNLFIFYFMERKTAVHNLYFFIIIIFFINRTVRNTHKNNIISKGPTFLLSISKLSRNYNYALKHKHNWCF